MTPAHSLGALLDGTGLIQIQPGEFQMGSNRGLADEQPVHRVRIGKPFAIGKFEVTQSQWDTVMREAHGGPDVETTVSAGSNTISSNPSFFKGVKLPVHNVSWDDVQVFLGRLNQRDPKNSYRLPTEAEWEYCCRAGQAGAIANLDSVAWFRGNAAEQVHGCGLKEPNAWGLHDMYGNVAEWVEDWYRFDYYAGSPLADPAGPKTGSYRVYRGGCWFDDASNFRASFRAFDFPISRFYHVGFRVVRTPAPARGL